jgi:hypothetical protein
MITSQYSGSGSMQLSYHGWRGLPLARFRGFDDF